jgi:hypothetical protein
MGGGEGAYTYSSVVVVAPGLGSTYAGFLTTQPFPSQRAGGSSGSGDGSGDGSG